jgi:hypothetical protein
MYSRRGKYSHNFRKRARTRIEIFPLRYMIETSGFFIHTFAAAISVREEVVKFLTDLQICRFNLTPKIGPLDLIQNGLQSS